MNELLEDAPFLKMKNEEEGQKFIKMNLNNLENNTAVKSEDLLKLTFLSTTFTILEHIAKIYYQEKISGEHSNNIHFSEIQ
ncbi:hypothetical protein PGTUg99_032339 [Puccinia graminis f. sp. tritici]|uniref:Uncharacterized protein n=1 Tax=Puccinia graminis f. sp. tritici TaxID=56615 RepID=A0A5B0QVP4_PUCGR|nr:hypothetical protein PGTUg99_032339 [Puccinia graminis f. sp. tritici]